MITPDRIIILITALCMLAGAVDCILGNRFRLGDKFTAGFEAFGSLAVTMSGILVLVPLISKALSSASVPGSAAGMLLACDMGGWPLAQALDADTAGLNGMLLGSMMGANVVFNIPVAMGMLKPEHRASAAKGILFGFITMPVGIVTGGLIAGYGILTILYELIPVIIVSAVIALCLAFIPDIIVRVFIVFGRIVSAIAVLSAAIGIFSALTGFTVIPGLGDIYEALGVVVCVVIALPGAYVGVELLSRALRKPFSKIGNKLGINEASQSGLIAALANCVPVFTLADKMDEKGRVINFAFLTSAGYALGDHLAFCAANAQNLTAALIIGKITAGICAAVIAATAVGKTHKQ